MERIIGRCKKGSREWIRREIEGKSEGGEERRGVEEGGEVRKSVDTPRSLYESIRRTDS